MAYDRRQSLTPLLSNTRILQPADIATLNSKPVVIVPSPGTTKIIVVLGIVCIYNYGTVTYYTAAPGVLTPQYAGSSNDQVAGTASALLLTSLTSGIDYLAGSCEAHGSLAADADQAIQLLAGSDYPASAILTAGITAQGLGYALHDTGTVTTGNADATYEVTGVGALGIVTSFKITYAGTGYVAGAGQATADGGAQPGVGMGLTINVTALQTGDGTLKVTTYYQILNVP